MPTKTESIKNFLLASTHRDLADLYDYNQEVQVNVAQDHGERVEGDFKGRKWHGWTDGITTWKSFRIPLKANSEPEYNDSEIRFDLAEHVEGIGMTGWDWVNRVSKWVAYDFDAIVGHSEKHTAKLTSEQLEEVKQAVWSIEWVTIRKSTSGKGLHLYVFLDNTPTQNHNEHAALARATLGKMSALAGYDFESKVDNTGQNMWVWHRKMRGTDGLKLLKQGEKLYDIPPNWRDHIKVAKGVRRKNLPQVIEESGEELTFEELCGQRPAVRLDEEHKRLINYLKDLDQVWWWDQDNKCLVTHTYVLKKAHDDLNLRGFFETISPATNINDQNCFMFPIRRGAWVVRRFTKGVQEHESWGQDSAGWTRCYLNREPDLATAAKAFGGIEDPKGGFIFREAEMAIKAAALLGVQANLDRRFMMREARLSEHKDGRIVMTLEKKDNDPSDEMIGWLPKKKEWTRIFSAQKVTPPESETGNYDDLVRHLVTENDEDYGWMIKSEGYWRSEPLSHIKVALTSLGISEKEIKQILGSSIFKAWKVVNKPFQPEYPGDREWNRNAAQLRFTPTQDIENLKFPTWLKLLKHCGSGLDDTVQQNGWCKANGIINGADYLKCWIASIFQQPLQPLPYLFLYGPQNSGKSILHEALSLLLTKGYVRADMALTNGSGFNGELENGIVCVIEETDLRKNKVAYNRIKDWVTARELPIHAKGQTVYHIPNSTHWIQCLPKHTWIMTADGPRKVGDLIGKPTKLYADGKIYNSNGFFETGYRDIYRLRTKEGFCVELTGDHPVLAYCEGMKLWIEAGSLLPGQQVCLHNHENIYWSGEGDFESGYILGWLLGDGSINHNYCLYFYGEKDEKPYNYIAKLLQNYKHSKAAPDGICVYDSQIKRIAEQFGVTEKNITDHIEEGSSDFYCGFLGALFDSDGSSSVEHRGLVLYQSNYTLLQKVQRMLARLGIISKIYLGRKAQWHYGPKGWIHGKDAYSLQIINYDNLYRCHTKIPTFRHGESISKMLDSWSRKPIDVSYTAKVSSLEYLGKDTVYDVTVEDIHAFDGNGFYLHNCSNEHTSCPIFSGDTRITMIYVESLNPTDLIPKKQLVRQLEKEAPDFLAELVNLEIPESPDRLNVPVISTSDKILVEQSNRSALEDFIDNNCKKIKGQWIKYSEFCEAFQNWCDPNELDYWTKRQIGKNLPPDIPKGRNRKNAEFYLGNIAWKDSEAEESTKLILNGQFLDPLGARNAKTSTTESE